MGIGKGLAALLAIGYTHEEYREDHRKSNYVMYARHDFDGEVVRTWEDDTITSHIQYLEVLISGLKEEMDHKLISTHNLMTRKAELEEELWYTRAEYEEEIDVLHDKFDDLKL
ncbi:hypothetical protein ZWY2020_028171 [Hordeum vulgare]|nr:hypothetical protein ZWY2020_028171 [Hordeum vulgare]